MDDFCHEETPCFATQLLHHCASCIPTSTIPSSVRSNSKICLTSPREMSDGGGIRALVRRGGTRDRLPYGETTVA